MQIEKEQVQPLQVVPLAYRHIRRKRLRISILFMAPAFLIIALFMIGPALWSIYISLTNTSLTGVGAATVVLAEAFCTRAHEDTSSSQRLSPICWRRSLLMTGRTIWSRNESHPSSPS